MTRSDYEILSALEVIHPSVVTYGEEGRNLEALIRFCEAGWVHLWESCGIKWWRITPAGARKLEAERCSGRELEP